MRKRKSGFTIAEVLVAISVFTVGILSIVQIFPLHYKLSRISEKSSVAIFLAQEQVEDLYALTYDEATIGTYEVKAPVASEGEMAQYQRETIIEYVNGDYSPAGSDLGLKKATVSVYWFEGALEKSESLVTLLSER